MYAYVWILAFLGTLWLYLRKTYSYFEKREVNHLPPTPIFGHMAKCMTRKEHTYELLGRLYHAFPEDRFVGFYEFTNKLTIIRDPELLKLIGVKDFEYFVDRRYFGSDKDTFFGRCLFGLKGQKWRDMRSSLSPAFTGSKLRGMVPLIQDCNNNVIQYLKSETEKSKGGNLDVDIKDLISRYTNDVIATCAFGLGVNSFAEKENDFFKMGKKLTTFRFLQILKIFCVLVIPFFDKVADADIFPTEVTRVLRNIFLSTMKNRDENNIFRPDLIQILMEVKKGTLAHENINDEKDAGFATAEESSIGKRTVKTVWQDDDLVAQAIVFFFAGFDTVSTVITFLLYELAVNTDVQDKLRKEIDNYYDEYKGEIEYDKMNQMKYLDMVVSESLRKWPPFPFMDRVCDKRYNMGKPHAKAVKDYILDKGLAVGIPIWPIHHDPRYYPDPERFDPERFSDTNKHNIKPFTYIPFGLGPRNCIGSRFAITEIKAMTFELLRNFELSPAPNTRIPVELDNSTISLRMKGGHWLRIAPRDRI